jgi:UDP-N-acetyl-2-amino-2-deoxyglucuronate dehydrogenase
MTYLFGNFLDLKVKINEQNRSSGQLTLENCSVDWLFSFHDDDIDSYISEKNLSYRSIEINGQNVDFSDVPEDLHTASYKKIHKGEGFTLYDAQPSIEIIDKINL